MSRHGEFVKGNDFLNKILTRTDSEIYYRLDNEKGLQSGEIFEYVTILGSTEVIDTNLGGIKEMTVTLTKWSNTSEL